MEIRNGSALRFWVKKQQSPQGTPCPFSFVTLGRCCQYRVWSAAAQCGRNGALYEVNRASRNKSRLQVEWQLLGTAPTERPGPTGE